MSKELVENEPKQDNGFTKHTGAAASERFKEILMEHDKSIKATLSQQDAVDLVSLKEIAEKCGGKFHGPRIESLSIPERCLLDFARKILKKYAPPSTAQDADEEDVAADLIQMAIIQIEKLMEHAPPIERVFANTTIKLLGDYAAAAQEDRPICEFCEGTGVEGSYIGEGEGYDTELCSHCRNPSQPTAQGVDDGMVRVPVEYIKKAEKAITDACVSAVEKLNEISPETGWDAGEKTAEIYIRPLREMLEAASKGE